jgi:hypothetical protein
MRKSLTRLVAGTAIAATALLTAAGTASASTTTALKPSSLSIVAAKSTITVGQWDTIGGTLVSGKTPLPGRTIVLDVWSSKTKKWYGVEEKLTGKYGKVDFAVRPAWTTAYELVFKGGSEHVATHSGYVWVVVKPKPVVKAGTTLSIAESKLAIKAGGTDIITGGLTLTADGKALPYRFVWLAWVGSKGVTHPEYALKTGKYGKVEFKVHPGKTTKYELLYGGTSVLHSAHSGVVTVTVQS